MRSVLIGWILLAAALQAAPAAAQAETAPIILSPSAGQTLQGQAAITGTTDIPNFASAELDFSYSADETNTRFLIQLMTQPIVSNLLATWDTTSITDGDYFLILRVTLSDGSVQEMKVPVKVTNYTALPTATATLMPTQPALQLPTPILLAATLTPTLSPLPTATPLPPNPLVIDEKGIYSEFWRGGLIVLIVFIAFGITIRLRRH